ncbi:MAG: type II secretion system F family protein [Notoacmeibacter sp.]|nr:type II secretion system F family protein [Notoacmeibacter sp.]MCC0031873.1 type II secretion system F family protein [Brucellaceae bacterium]
MPLALMMLALGGAALAWPLVTQERGRNDLKRRLRVEPDAAEVVEEAPRAVRQRGNQVQDKALKKAQEFYAKTDPDNVARLRMKLIQAGYLDPRAVPAFFLARAGAMAICAIIGAVMVFGAGFSFGGNDWVPVLGAALAGYFIPSLVLHQQISAKIQEYRNGFPDFMDLMVVCTDAGMSMEAGIDRVSREIANTYPSLSHNLQLVSLELRAGRTLNDALKSLADRLSLDEVRSFATLLQQSKELGTSLSSALRVFSDEMRHKRMSRAEEKAHALPAKMSVPVTACILPVVLLVAIIPVIVQLSNM